MFLKFNLGQTTILDVHSIPHFELSRDSQVYQSLVSNSFTVPWVNVNLWEASRFETNMTYFPSFSCIWIMVCDFGPSLALCFSHICRHICWLKSYSMSLAAAFMITWRLDSESLYGCPSSSARLSSPGAHGVVLYCSNDKLGLASSDLHLHKIFLMFCMALSVHPLLEWWKAVYRVCVTNLD